MENIKRMENIEGDWCGRRKIKVLENKRPQKSITTAACDLPHLQSRSATRRFVHYMSYVRLMVLVRIIKNGRNMFILMGPRVIDNQEAHDPIPHEILDGVFYKRIP